MQSQSSVQSMLPITTGDMFDIIKNYRPRGKGGLLFVGPTGVGKSEIAVQAAKASGRPAKVIMISQMEPTDVLGLPVADIEEGVMRYLVNKFWKELLETPNAVVIFEEINRAMIQTQNAFYRMINEKIAGDVELSESLTIVALANPPDAYNMVNPIAIPFLNRFIIFNVEANADDWLGWASTNGIHPSVQAYIYAHPDALCPLIGNEANLNELNQVTSPRGWEKASDILYSSPPSNIRDAMLVGALGVKRGNDFIAWLATERRIPNPRLLISGQEIFPDAPDLQYVALFSVTTALMDMLKKDFRKNDVDILCRFFDTTSNPKNNWPTEMVSVFARTMSNSEIGRDTFRRALLVDKRQEAKAFSHSDAAEILKKEADNRWQRKA